MNIWLSCSDFMETQPVAGLAHLHGKKGKAMVHIGAVDAPVTIDEINAAIAECVQVKAG